VRACAFRAVSACFAVNIPDSCVEQVRARAPVHAMVRERGPSDLVASLPHFRLFDFSTFLPQCPLGLGTGGRRDARKHRAEVVGQHVAVAVHVRPLLVPCRVGRDLGEDRAQIVGQDLPIRVHVTHLHHVLDLERTYPSPTAGTADIPHRDPRAVGRHRTVLPNLEDTRMRNHLTDVRVHPFLGQSLRHRIRWPSLSESRRDGIIDICINNAIVRVKRGGNSDW
jgi:hypothetical protein